MVNEPDVEIYLCAHNLESLKLHFPNSKFKFIQLKSTSKWRRLGIELPSLCKQLKFDFAHFQYITPFFKTTRYITTIHDILFYDFPDYFPKKYRFLNGFLFRRSAKISDAVFTVSAFSKNAINHYYHLKPDKIFITPNAVSLKEEGNASLINLPQKYILYVSRFEPRKNQIGLLNVFRKLNLHSQGYHLVFVGSKKEELEINYFNQVKSQINSEISPFIHFLEGLNPDELVSIYKKSSCFVYPSFAEGFGIPPIEAAVLGVKVLCSNTTSMEDFDFLKYRFNPHNENEFEEKLTLILADKNYPFEEIKQKTQERFNWNKIANETCNYLKQILQQK